jgi:hypothetical protein
MRLWFPQCSTAAVGLSLGVSHLVSATHGALAFTSDPPTTAAWASCLLDKVFEHYNTMYFARRGLSHLRTTHTGIPSSCIVSTLRSPATCAFCYFLVGVIGGAFESSSVDISMKRGQLHLMTTWLNAAKTLRCTPFNFCQ